MAALTTGRNTRSKFLGRSVTLKIKAATKIFKGSIVAVEAATGWAVPAGDTAGHIVIGIAAEDADNTAGANGALSVQVYKGTFHLNNGAAPAVQATIGDVVMVQDDNAIRITSTNSVAAGTCDELDPDGGVWVAVP